MENLSPILAQRLKDLRESRGLTLAVLSKALTEKYGIHISKESLTNYEVTDSFHTKARKNEGMSVKYLRCLADFYGVSTDYLLGLSDIPTNEPDIRAACLTTGLSVAAIQAIAGSSQIDEYNYLLTLDSFEYFLNVLHKYKEHWNNLLKSEIWQHQQADACSKEGQRFAYIDPESSIHAKMLRCAELDLHKCISAITGAIDATYQNRKEGEQLGQHQKGN